MTPPLFLVAALADDRVVLDGPEGRHASDVVRLRVGETVLLGDGAGTVAEAQVSEVARGRLLLDITARRLEARQQPRLVVVQALAKGGRDEDAVEAMTEIGVDEIAGWSAARSVAKWTDRTGGRWQASARAATKQSRRAWLPQVNGPLTTAQVAERLREAQTAVVLHEDAMKPLAMLKIQPTGDVVLVVGPEGGITDDELAVFEAAGAHTCRLGTTVLRTSTAGVAALSAISAATRWRTTS